MLFRSMAARAEFGIPQLCTTPSQWFADGRSRPRETRFPCSRETVDQQAIDLTSVQYFKTVTNQSFSASKRSGVASLDIIRGFNNISDGLTTWYLPPMPGPSVLNLLAMQRVVGLQVVCSNRFTFRPSRSIKVSAKQARMKALSVAESTMAYCTSTFRTPFSYALFASASYFPCMVLSFGLLRSHYFYS